MPEGKFEIRCPACGKTFSWAFSQVYFGGGCASDPSIDDATLKCPHCDYEEETEL